MKITFLGVGEAFDEKESHVCILVEASGRRMIIDCGSTAPPEIWKNCERPDYLDGIFISHFHADHFFGLPALMIRMWEDGRTRPFYLFGPLGMQKRVEVLMESAYPGSMPRRDGKEGGIPFTLRFRELQRSHRWDDWNLRVVNTKHTVQNLGLRLEAGKKVLCYSGDGMFTPTAAKLYSNASLIIHETYKESSTELRKRTHCTIDQLERLDDMARPKQIALVHLHRDLRKKRASILKKHRTRNWIIPKKGEFLEI